jgi:hypothetical protein
VTHHSDTAKALHDAAAAILKLRGSFAVDDGGMAATSYSDDDLRICHQPAISGSSMPSYLDVWAAGSSKQVFVARWFAGTGVFETIALRPGTWQRRLTELAAAPARLKEARLQAAREARTAIGAGEGAKLPPGHE